jgi:hypothetical protein
MEMPGRGMGDGDGMQGSVEPLGGGRGGGGEGVGAGPQSSGGPGPVLASVDPAAGLQLGAEVGLGDLPADGDVGLCWTSRLGQSRQNAMA